jgi:hypothetical protein
MKRLAWHNIFILAFSCSVSGQALLPDRIWGTYYGGSVNEEIFCICEDPDGNLYFTGSTFSPDNMATPGSFQENLAGEADAFLAKFTPDGVRLWATYYGGPAMDAGWWCEADQDGNVYLAGHTHSATGIATPGAHQTLLRGEQDAFLVKFTPEGQRI